MNVLRTPEIHGSFKAKPTKSLANPPRVGSAEFPGNCNRPKPLRDIFKTPCFNHFWASGRGLAPSTLLTTPYEGFHVRGVWRLWAVRGLFNNLLWGEGGSGLPGPVNDTLRGFWASRDSLNNPPKGIRRRAGGGPGKPRGGFVREKRHLERVA